MPATLFPVLHTGTFTVVVTSPTAPSGKASTTIRIRQVWFKSNTLGQLAPGENTIGEWKFVAEFLRGPDNENDYTGFAFVDLERRTFSIWRKWRNSRGLKLALEVLCGNPQACSEAYALRSGRCSRCRKVLTVPASLHRGLGPECAKRVFA